MKKILSLALSFTLGSLSLAALCARPARAQQVASVGGSISKLRDEYARLLAVDRDPSTEPDVREINRKFLEERRAQLSEALRERVEGLRKYRASILTTLDDDEKGAVEDSIRRLADELQALQQGGAATPSENARRPRVQAAGAIRKVSLGGESEAGGGAGAPKADGIEIASPDGDKTVGVGQIELEIKIDDEDLDDLMVAVYTPDGGMKPVTARAYEVKRSDHGRKTIPIKLTAGVNRIEVSDLRRGDLKAVRTITYVPARDILGAAPQGEGDNSTPVKSLVVRKLEKALDAAGDVNAGKVVICGQLQLASLNRTFSLIRSTPALGDLAARFRPADSDPRRESEDQDSPGGIDFLIASQIKDDCTFNGAVRRDGLQRTAAIDLLSAVLLRLDSGLNPKDTEINRTALRNETAYLLEKTSTESRIKSKARVMRGAGANPAQNEEAAETDADREADKVVSQYAKLEKNSAFSTLSADTIRKEIVLLQQYIGNVEVRLTHDGKVIDQTLTDRDGNFVFAIDAPGADDKEYTISTEGDEHFTTRSFLKSAFLNNVNKLRLNLDIEDRPVSLLARSLIGFDQSGAAAAKRDFTYFFDFYVSKSFPFRQHVNPDFGERLRLWGDFRINSVPQTAEATLPDFAGSGFVTGIKNLKVNEVARVFEFLGGTEFRLTGNNALLPSFDRETKQKFSLSFIGAFGFVTPVDPTGSTPTIFRVFDDAPGLPPAAKGKEFVAFIPDSRDRFFRQYYAGLRVQTFFFNKHNIPLQRFPAQFDVTIGQNEFVTGGRLHGPVLRMESFFPLPYDKLKFVNLFATAQMIPGRPNIGTPLVLQSAPDTVTVPAANVALIGLPQPNRDHYRIGISFDAIPLLKKVLSPSVPGTGGSTTPPGAAAAGQPNP